MGETRINLKHLLEDIRDGYPIPIEEVIVTELIANALDSGASEIAVTVDLERKTLSLADNGQGMKKGELKSYHDIAATTKKKGSGIGFAGVGAKLALLLAETVVTETKSAHFYGATNWLLKNPMKAPWQKTQPCGLIQEHGTVVTVYLNSADSQLLDVAFIGKVIRQHFYSLLNHHFDSLLKLIYKKGVNFIVNGRQLIETGNTADVLCSKSFMVRLGRQRSPVGIGYAVKSQSLVAAELQGIAVSTYGKVIKRGWEWLGLSPRSEEYISGCVEIPGLAKILTTNKADFLGDKNSLNQYYQYRRAIQTTLISILQEFGEDINLERGKIETKVRPVEKEIGRVLGTLVGDFPELATLVGWKPSQEKEDRSRSISHIPQEVAVVFDSAQPKTLVENLDSDAGPMDKLVNVSPPAGGVAVQIEKKLAGKKSGLTVGFADDIARKELGWLLEDTIWINRSHPAYIKAKTMGQETYHLAVSVAWVLTDYIETEKSQREFINRFLELWGRSIHA